MHHAVVEKSHIVSVRYSVRHSGVNSHVLPTTVRRALIHYSVYGYVCMYPYVHTSDSAR